jgi:hypothetical protein
MGVRLAYCNLRIRIVTLKHGKETEDRV